MRTILVVLTLICASGAHAQSRTHKPRAAQARHGKPHKAKASAPKAAARLQKSEVQRSEQKAGQAEAMVPPDPSAPSGASPPADAASDTAAEIRNEGDTQVKVMEFSGLDIEGQLKTPQMLYFLKRLRAEFGRPRLPHRSFMPELQRSADSKAF
jgi:hypothetical protein